MALFDTIKKAAAGKQNQIDKGVDALAKFARGRAPAKYDSKISAAAKQAKKAAGKIAGPPVTSHPRPASDLSAANRTDNKPTPTS